MTCCCCFPISCGVYTIAILIVLVTIFLFTEIFFELLDDLINWWYVAIAVVLLIPAVIGSAFAVRFLSVNRNSSRGLLIWGCILVIVSAVLVVIWNTIYFIYFYEPKSVETGRKELGLEFTSTTKVQVFYGLLLAAIVCATFSYFICVTSSYKDAL